MADIEKQNVSRESILEGLKQELVYVLKINKKLGTDLNVQADSQFTSDLGMDSLDIVEFVARSEARFRFHVKDSDFEKMRNLNEICNFVCVKLDIN